ncbi:hypothetical protein IU451_28900 [Nocardia cyriacigeorgica]|uniref:hypothetical protein n=1 Tax=Nocardia cyriacigeorgica TaxID=135487 RepID=UPI0018944735|nr:hypothetical protein [Nocardia cyriacigeorgica]MBF6326522.1 hypothetical protein [Nocardia cyriacigeorgica]
MYAIDHAVQALADTTDTRVHGRKAAAAEFAGHRCDECGAPALMFTETVTELARGAEREGGIYCLDHGIAAIEAFTWSDGDQIEVTVPEHLATSAAYLAA